MILLLNGAFGIGKTTVARALVPRLPRAVVFDPEWTGIVLQRLLRLVGRPVDDFQDLRMWRRLTVVGLRVTRMLYRNVVVPMAFRMPGTSTRFERVFIALSRISTTLSRRPD